MRYVCIHIYIRIYLRKKIITQFFSNLDLNNQPTLTTICPTILYTKVLYKMGQNLLDMKFITSEPMNCVNGPCRTELNVIGLDRQGHGRHLRFQQFS